MLGLQPLDLQEPSIKWSKAEVWRFLSFPATIGVDDPHLLQLGVVDHCFQPRTCCILLFEERWEDLAEQDVGL